MLCYFSRICTLLINDDSRGVVHTTSFAVDKQKKSSLYFVQDSLPVTSSEIVLKQPKLKAGKAISPELLAFARTLNYFSAAAYDYVRKTFGNCLPHPSTLRKSFGVINGKPLILSEALKAVKNKVQTMASKNKTLFCGLMMDEMSIKKDVHFNGVHNIVYVNMGTKNDESDALPMASDILVFMLVA